MIRVHALTIKVFRARQPDPDQLVVLLSSTKMVHDRDFQSTPRFFEFMKSSSPPRSPALPSSSVYVPLGVLPLPIAFADAALALAAEEVLPSPAAVARPLNADSPGPVIKASHDVIDLLSSPWSHNESHVPLAVTRSRRILSAAAPAKLLPPPLAARKKAIAAAIVEVLAAPPPLPPPLAARKKADAAAAAAAAAVATAVALFDESAAAGEAAEAAVAADGTPTERQVGRTLRAHHTDAPSCPWVGPRSTRSTRRALQPRTGNEAQQMAAGRVVPNAAATGRAAALATDGGMALKGEARSYAAIERRRGVLSHK